MIDIVTKKCKCGKMFITHMPNSDLSPDSIYFLCTDCVRRRSQNLMPFEQIIRQIDLGVPLDEVQESIKECVGYKNKPTERKMNERRKASEG